MLVGVRCRDVPTGAVVDEAPGSVFVLLCSVFITVGYVPTEKKESLISRTERPLSCDVGA